MSDNKSQANANQDSKKQQRVTIVEEGTEFSGQLKSNCPLHIKGKVEGQITAPAINIARSGSLTGTAKLGQLLSEGEISGTFEADVVRLAGRVGNKTTIKTRALEAKLAAKDSGIQVTFGECTLEVGDEPKEPKQTSEKADTPAPKQNESKSQGKKKS